MLPEFLPAAVLEGAGFLPDLKLRNPAHAIFKLLVLEQTLNNICYSIASEGCFLSVS